MTESIESISKTPSCNNKATCRDWTEIKNVAFCKAAKLATILPPHYELYYVSTNHKTEAIHEWAKLVYGFVNKQQNLVTYLKLCVPVDRKDGAWLDDRCPLDDCGEMEGTLGDCRQKKEKQKITYEVLNKNGGNEKNMVKRMS